MWLCKGEGGLGCVGHPRKPLPCWHRWSHSQGQPRAQWRQSCCCTWLGRKAGFHSCEFASERAATESHPGLPRRRRSSVPGRDKNKYRLRHSSLTFNNKMCFDIKWTTQGRNLVQFKTISHEEEKEPLHWQQASKHRNSPKERLIKGNSSTTWSIKQNWISLTELGKTHTKIAAVWRCSNSPKSARKYGYRSHRRELCLPPERPQCSAVRLQFPSSSPEFFSRSHKTNYLSEVRFEPLGS